MGRSPRQSRRLTLVVTGATLVALAAALAPAALGAPVATQDPRISGTARVGETLATTDGVWDATDTIALSYEWQRCAPGGAYGNDCRAIPGATGQTYVVRSADVGSRLRSDDIATSAAEYYAGTTRAPSGRSSIVKPRPTTGGNDTINGGGLNDSLSGGAGHDTVNGAGGNDSLSGGAGNDTLNGGPGNDRIQGGSGNDSINGEAGDDVLTGGAGRDTISGGTGNDTIDARDGVADLINCGAGHDIALVDGRDIVRPGCESVRMVL
jgi:Ca2+-binding RTX toxin-like protein